MKLTNKLICLCMLLCFNTNYAQDNVICKTVNRKPEKLIFQNKKNKESLKGKLDLNKNLVELLCNSKINKIKINDFLPDSTSSIKIVNSGVTIYLKKSFFWNLDNEPPKIANTTVLKLMLKKEEKISNNEWRILKYIDFYSQNFSSKTIEKYECKQEILINQHLRYIVTSIVKYNVSDKLFVESRIISCAMSK